MNPRAYLHLVARRIVDGWAQSRLRDLLPDRTLHAHPELFVGDDHELAAVTSGALAAPSETSPRSSASKSRVAGIKMKSPGVCWVAETQHRTPGSFK
ncbi:MAG: transposase domain-containing protein [Polyangiaceae bacterium]|nr:transposase domain-containing protein [Polyangiaceae bacterium]